MKDKTTLVNVIKTSENDQIARQTAASNIERIDPAITGEEDLFCGVPSHERFPRILTLE